MPYEVSKVGLRVPTERGMAQLITEQVYPIGLVLKNAPAVVNNRERVGDWEADTIIGKNHKGAIATLDERKTKLRLAVPLPGKKAKAVKQAMIGVLKPLEKYVKTITYDNGK